ncbi:hypothetical protein P7H60_08125 [Vagococcus carniphilus]|uniref:hypothetical protein n=1 Tax=Vagococcus carniphilus TaxID=218144 RepID=UPI00288E1541|nr:hypothetical protein [Vagococcus carniphilus]MDT2849131.1 hypothetical protein [Vagococcus carniphilus]
MKNLNNDKRVFYKDVDRIIRIVYKEMNFNTTNFFDLKWYEYFDLSNENFIRVIKTNYIKFYPDNYHEDDLDYLLIDLAKKIKNKYGSTNSIYLIPYISTMILKYDQNQLYVDFNDLLEWDGFINKLDIKLFVSSMLASNCSLEPEVYGGSVVGHNNFTIYDICSRNGISENHMHLQASGYVTDINWFSFLEKNIFQAEYFNQFICSEEVYKQFPKTKKNIDGLRNNIMKVKSLRVILHDYCRYNEFIIPPNIISQLLASSDVESFCSIQGISTEKGYEKLSKKLNEDVIKYIKCELRRYPDNPLKYSWIELDFMRRIFDIMLNSLKTDNHSYFTYLFNLYICSMMDIKFQFLQDNLGMGFNKFKEKEENKKWFITSDHEKDIIKSCFHKYYREKYINNIELRIAPKETGEKYIHFINELNRINLNEWERVKHEHNDPLIPKINFGVVIHFIKLKHKKKSSYVEEMKETRLRLEEQSNSIINALYLIEKNTRGTNKKCNLMNKIVGIDTANYEMDNRPNIYACVFRKLRYDQSTNQVLNATYHVGEEFPTITNGLRAIDEVLEFCAYNRNDRLGHALALGMDIAAYFKVKRNNILCCIEDYLDDIVWMSKVLNESSYEKDKQFLPFLRAEFDKYKHSIFSKIFSENEVPCFEDYLDAYILRGDDPSVYLEIIKGKLDFEYSEFCSYYGYRINSYSSFHEMAFLNKKARRLVLEYNYNEQYRLQAKQPIKIIVTEMYIKVAKRVQTVLKEKILNMNVFIEANPTSNKKISHIKNYSDLPAIRLNNLFINSEESICLPISINTDDSSIFQTNLINEYSMIAAALLREGINEREVYDYIERLAIASNVHSFIGKHKH